MKDRHALPISRCFENHPRPLASQCQRLESCCTKGWKSCCAKGWKAAAEQSPEPPENAEKQTANPPFPTKSPDPEPGRLASIAVLGQPPRQPRSHGKDDHSRLQAPTQT